MKYSEYLQLAEVLNKIEELEELFEAEPTQVGQLDTERGNWFTRWGLMKNKLNRNAKKIQDKVINKIVQKYLPSILETEVNAAKQVAELIQEQKQPKEIMQIMQKNLGTIANIQKQQLSTISKTIDEFVTSNAAKLNSKIDASKMNEKNKLNVKNYWLLLTTQIKMNAFQHISKKIQEAVAQVLGSDANAIKFQRATSPNQNIINSAVETIKQDVNKKKIVVQADEEEAKKAEKSPVASTSEPGKLPEIGKKYKYTTVKGDVQDVTITQITEDGIEVKTDAGKSYSVKKDRADKFVPIKSEVKRDVTL